MEMFEGNVEDFNNRFAADAGVHARFYLLPVKNEDKSNEAGRPIYDEKEFVEIVAAGNATNIIKRKATSEDKGRFRRQYELFKQGMEDQLTGTPLVEVSWLTRSQVEELAYFKIRTLEALANLDDAMCGKVAGLYDLKRRAANHVTKAEAAAPIEALHAENKHLQSELDSLKQVVAEQTALLKQFNEEKGKK